MCICMYAVYVYTYIYMYVCVYMCIFIYVYTYMMCVWLYPKKETTYQSTGRVVFGCAGHKPSFSTQLLYLISSVDASSYANKILEQLYDPAPYAPQKQWKSMRVEWKQCLNKKGSVRKSNFKSMTLISMTLIKPLFSSWPLSLICKVDQISSSKGKLDTCCMGKRFFCLTPPYL